MEAFSADYGGREKKEGWNCREKGRRAFAKKIIICKRFLQKFIKNNLVDMPLQCCDENNHLYVLHFNVVAKIKGNNPKYCTLILLLKATFAKMFGKRNTFPAEW